MIQLNTNYDDIKSQLLRLKDYIYKDSSPVGVLACMQTYNALSLFYYISKGEVISPRIVKYNRTLVNEALQKEKRIFNNYVNNFFLNKDFHSAMFSSFYFEVMDLIDEFYDGDYYQKLISVYNKPINVKKNEDLDILLQFFREVDPGMKELFLDLVRQGKFYKMNPAVPESTGMTVFNSIENLCNVFIKERTPSIAYLTTFVHETGHVKDYLDCGERFSPEKQKLYLMKGLYSEVLSTFYEQKFYEFLFDNDIRREEVVLGAMKYFYNYISGIDDAILYSLLPDEYHFQAVAGNLTRDQMAAIIDNGPLEVDDSGSIPESFDDTMGYGYGIMIANSILHDQKKYNDFLNIRNGYFDANKLEGIGITPDDVSKQLIKNIKKFSHSGL